MVQWRAWDDECVESTKSMPAPIMSVATRRTVRSVWIRTRSCRGDCSAGPRRTDPYAPPAVSPAIPAASCRVLDSLGARNRRGTRIVRVGQMTEVTQGDLEEPRAVA